MKSLLWPTTTAFCLGALAAGAMGIDLFKGFDGMVSPAHAQSASDQQYRGGSSGRGGGSGGQGYQGGRSTIDAEIFRGRGERVIIIFEDDDSDRPEWAGGNTDLNPHSQGGGQPAGAGTKKGDLYGDLYYVVRDPITGVALYFDPATGEVVNPDNPVAELKLCLDVGCSEFVYSVDGEVPEGSTPAEVDFGRTNVVRAPESVTDHALDEVIAKLTTAITVTTDEAGRLVLDDAAIDSPLENLALYIALLTGDPALTPELLAKLPGDTLVLAASLLAGGADKTGDIDLDFVYNINQISGVAEDYYDYSSFTYSRTYPADYTYYYFDTDGVTVLSATLDINAYLQAVNGSLPTDGGITLFSVAADDALEVIELVHTQIHEGLLPGTDTGI